MQTNVKLFIFSYNILFTTYGHAKGQTAHKQVKSLTTVRSSAIFKHVCSSTWMPDGHPSVTESRPYKRRPTQFLWEGMFPDIAENRNK